MGQPPRIYCDFNDGDDVGGYFILWHDQRPLADCMDELGLSEGTSVILYQDEDDFEVQATLKRGRTNWDVDAWVAIPDWETKRDIQ